LQCCVSDIKVAVSVEIYSVQRPFYHVIGLAHSLMDLSMFDIATVGLPPDSADFGGRAAWESLAESAFSTLGLLGFSLNRYTSRLVNYCCQDYWFLQYDIYVSYPSGATWKELVQIAQFLVTTNLEHLLYQNTDRKRNQCFQ
jgi:hypothetical protein